MIRLLLALALSAAPAAAREKKFYVPFTPPSGLFSAEIPEGWATFEEETPRGMVTHIIGPAELHGSWKAAYHVHFFDKAKPGFVDSREAMKLFRERDKLTDRDADQITTWRVDNKPGKMFQVRETRVLPGGRLPAERVSLHHFYMFIPSGRDEYYMIKLSTTEETFLGYRAEFRRFMSTFKTR